MEETAKAIMDKVRTEGRRFVMEPEAKAILKARGLPVTEERVCHSPLEAVSAAQRIGYPVVMKLVSPQVVHKTEHDAVKLDLVSDLEVADAYYSLTEVARKSDAQLAGILVSEMASGLEMMIGSFLDPQFGQLIMLGMGGVLVELYKDVTYRLAPLEENDARAMLSELKGARLLQGYRGGKRLDADALISTVMTVSQMLVDLPDIAEMDLNPIFVGVEGVKVADARILLS